MIGLIVILTLFLIFAVIFIYSLATIPKRIIEPFDLSRYFKENEVIYSVYSVYYGKSTYYKNRFITNIDYKKLFDNPKVEEIKFYTRVKLLSIDKAEKFIINNGLASTIRNKRYHVEQDYITGDRYAELDNFGVLTIYSFARK